MEEKIKSVVLIKEILFLGRIILGKELANYLRATYLGNPPRSMLPLRRLFDREKGMLRKAYFSLCMYVGAHHVRETWVREPVVTTGLVENFMLKVLR